MNNANIRMSIKYIYYGKNVLNILEILKLIASLYLPLSPRIYTVHVVSLTAVFYVHRTDAKKINNNVQPRVSWVDKLLVIFQVSRTPGFFRNFDFCIFI